MQRSSVTALLVCLFGLSTLQLCALHAAEEPPGLVKEKPAEGFSVQTEQGWMVAYEMAIPGTDVKFRMVPVPGGEYLMGSPATEPHRKDDEGPQRKVVVAPFWMGECEVTWA
jgi:formylglycine-generating enzyme required for sulfatase activity